MPKVHHVKKSRKEFPGIPKGSEYWWWKFAFRPMIRSLKYPETWQLTRSKFLSEYLRIKDKTAKTLSSWDDLESLVSELEDLRDKTQSKLNNMSAESGWTVKLLETRISELEKWINQIDIIAMDHEDEIWVAKIQNKVTECSPVIE